MSFEPRTEHRKQSTTCTQRVWSNGDCENCGSESLRKGLCAEHLQDHINELQKRKKELRAELDHVEKELWDHQHESG